MRFNVGDLARVRSWEDMQNEFGLSAYNSIDCQYYFTDAMRSLCGTEFIISEIKGSRIYGLDTTAMISADMLEKVDYQAELEESDSLIQFLDSININ